MNEELSPRVIALFEQQRRLQSEAAAVIMDLRLLDVLRIAGVPKLVGSLATGLMVWRDIDCTVVCEQLDMSVAATVASRLLEHPRVRSVQIRNDTGRWNEDPATYPDGLFLGVDYRSDEHWELDIWFVDEPQRQPDLQHTEWLGERLTDDTRASILELKHHLHGTPEYSSYRICQAVLEHDVRSVEEFESWNSTPQ